jgi:hypothetical protein
MDEHMKQKEIKITTFKNSEYDGNPPSRFYIINAMGDYVFIHVRSRIEATDWVKEHYDGKYNVRTTALDKAPDNPTARGTQTRRGQKK